MQPLPSSMATCVSMLLVPVCIFRYPASSLLLPALLPCALVPSACLSIRLLRCSWVPFRLRLSMHSEANGCMLSAVCPSLIICCLHQLCIQAICIWSRLLSLAMFVAVRLQHACIMAYTYIRLITSWSTCMWHLAKYHGKKAP
jgi:hypothetical protein